MTEYFLVMTRLIHRYFFDIANTFAQGDGRVVILRTPQIPRLDKYAHYVDCLPDVELREPTEVNPVDGSVLVSDDASFIRRHQHLFRKRIEVSYDYYRVPSGSLRKPYPMHPNVYKNRLPRPEVEKRYRISFAGNVARHRYAEPVLKEAFNVMSRVECFETILDMIGDELEPARVALNRLPDPDDYFAGVVLIERKHLEIEATEWLNFVGKSDFFLPLPGVAMPMCHGIIEAIFCGTIPILHVNQVPELGLVDGANCFTYGSKAQLKNLICDLLDGDRFPRERLEEVRRNVLHYYDRHLSLEAFARRLRAINRAEVRLFVNAEQESVSYLTGEARIVGAGSEGRLE
jgi:hypothetical protein